MQDSERRKIAFIRILLKSSTTRISETDTVRISHGKASASLTRVQVRELEREGILHLAGGILSCRDEARSWLRRKLATDGDVFRAQHLDQERSQTGEVLNCTENALSRLGAARAGQKPFLDPHHLQAGFRLRQLIERAHLRPRTTMNYSSERTVGANKSGRPADIPDMAADARKELARLHAVLPAECMGVLLDICGLEKGLQVVESERGWPRRSAKLVLRIGLEQLARHLGLASEAQGKSKAKPAFWLDEGARPDVFG